MRLGACRGNLEVHVDNVPIGASPQIHSKPCWICPPGDNRSTPADRRVDPWLP